MEDFKEDPMEDPIDQSTYDPSTEDPMEDLREDHREDPIDQSADESYEEKGGNRSISGRGMDLPPAKPARKASGLSSQKLRERKRLNGLVLGPGLAVASWDHVSSLSCVLSP